VPPLFEIPEGDWFCPDHTDFAQSDPRVNKPSVDLSHLGDTDDDVEFRNEQNIIKRDPLLSINNIKQKDSSKKPFKSANQFKSGSFSDENINYKDLIIKDSSQTKYQAKAKRFKVNNSKEDLRSYNKYIKPSDNQLNSNVRSQDLDKEINQMEVTNNFIIKKISDATSPLQKNTNFFRKLKNLDSVIWQPIDTDSVDPFFKKKKKNFPPQ
jgi:hypothetical protein